MSEKFPFHLDKTSKKYICPQCNKKRFVIYVNAETLEPINEYAFGRCDRESECGYHNAPQIEKKKGASDSVLHQIFPDENKIKSLKRQPSNFHNYLTSKGFDTNALYTLGMLEENGLTVFVFCDKNKNVVNFKWFKYKKDGHRDHDFASFSLKQPEQTNQYVKDYYGLCLYLEHTLDPEKKKIVCIVESEKTAAICKITYPQFDWVSCGSASGLSDGSDNTADKISPLKGREVYWIADADKAGRGQYIEKEKGKPETKEWIWPSSVRNLIKHIDKVHVVDLFPTRTDGYDIGDAVLDGLKPEIKPTWTKGRNSNELHDKRHQSIVVIDEEELIKEFRNGKAVGEESRIEAIKENFSWKRAFQNCWTGWPNDGKSTYFMFMALMKSLVDDWVWCIWPPEMLNTYKDSNGKIKTSGSDIVDELVFMLTGKCPYLHYQKMYNIPQMPEFEYREAVQWVKKHFIIINPKQRKYTDLLDNFRYFYDVYKFDGALVDPFKNLDHNESEGRFDLYLDRVFSDTKEFALETDTSMNWIAHPKAQVDPKNQDGTFKICTQYMLSGGAAWNNSMDGIYSIARLFKHLNPIDPRVAFLNLKQRKQQLVGRVGKYDKIEFLFQTNRYYFDGHCPIDGTYNEPLYKKIENAKAANAEKAKAEPKKGKQKAAAEPTIDFEPTEHDTIF
jgi:hypothetical protein